MSDTNSENWYVIRTKPKCEHLAAAHLKLVDGCDVFCPRIRFERATRTGPKWFVESLFPGYLFATFDLENQLRQINGTPNVSGVVRFGDLFPPIDLEFLDQLKVEFPQEENALRILDPEISEGDEIEVVTGPMAGLRTIVTRYVPAQERINILLEMLGEEREVEVAMSDIRKPGDVRAHSEASRK